MKIRQHTPSRVTDVSIRIISALRRQISHILEHRLPSVIGKPHEILGMLLLLPVLLGARLLRPFVLVRFGPLRGNRIGDFAFDTELYLCERGAGIHGRRAFDIFYIRYRVCNRQLKRMWQRTLHVYPFASLLDRLNRWVPGGEVHTIPIATRQFAHRDIHGVLTRFPPHVSFTSMEEHMGREGLQKMGIAAGVPFVCFMARDSAYLDSVYPEIDWYYQGHRDASIQNYVPAADELTRRGNFALRMGAVVQEKLKSTNPMIIDYATHFRTDFMDIYLGSQCRFLLINDAGYLGVAEMFRRPIAWTNIPCLELVRT